MKILKQLSVLLLFITIGGCSGNELSPNGNSETMTINITNEANGTYSTEFYVFNGLGYTTTSERIESTNNYQKTKREYIYDSENRIIEVLNNPGSIYAEFIYSGNSVIQSIYNQDGNKINELQYDLDSEGRVVKKKHTNGDYAKYYWVNGNITLKEMWLSDGSLSRSLKYDYDTNNTVSGYWDGHSGAGGRYFVRNNLFPIKNNPSIIELVRTGYPLDSPDDYYYKYNEAGFPVEIEWYVSPDYTFFTYITYE